MSKQKAEETIVNTRKITCEGESRLFGHPKIYLQIDDTGVKECPYCGKVFKLRKKSQDRD